jgi:hypothetical protein
MTHLDFLVAKVDYARAKSLVFLLRPQLFRRVYRSFIYRIGLGFILTMCFYLPISLMRPDILLFTGPLIFGYPHLIASFRFLRPKGAHLFIGLTGVCIVGHLYFTSKIPFGVWQVVVAFGGVVIHSFCYREVNVKKIIFALIVFLGLTRLAYLEPIVFVGDSLILHNWIGFLYWIKDSKEAKRKKLALSCTGLFFMVHFFVLMGWMDSFISIPQNNETITTSWYLASWSQNPMVWQRMMVLYAFGLSMHYFVWLKAIPENRSHLEYPNSFRLTLKNSKEQMGTKIFKLSLLIALVGMLSWLFSTKLGNQVYFECAILHGMLEIMFLL